MSRVSIVVPSYRRPHRLAQSLVALARQSRQVDEVIVVCRLEDAETFKLAGDAADVLRIKVDMPGVLAAMRAGARAASGDCIGFVDDDAEPHEAWLEGVLDHLADPEVGAVGGRDIVEHQPEHVLSTDVGRLTANGKLIGNHHLGTGPARDVDVLKAANMVFRRPALALPDGLRGEGAQVHFEVATSLWAAAQGWRLIYDPALAVDHYAGPRFDDDARWTRSARASANAAFNLSLCIGALRPDLRRRRLAYGVLVGDKGAPGLLRVARAVAQRDSRVAVRLVPSIRGQVAAFRRTRGEEQALGMYVYPSAGVEAAWTGAIASPYTSS
jgi:GT2 family glycosyltransferase